MIKELQGIYEKERKARVEFENAIIKFMPVGSFVFYDHGYQERTGTVLNHAHERIKIEAQNGNRIWIYASRVNQVTK